MTTRINDYKNFDCEFSDSLDCESDKFPDKNRSVSRVRYHSEVKHKKKSKEVAKILISKVKKLSWNATEEEEYRLLQKAERADKKARRIKTS